MSGARTALDASRWRNVKQGMVPAVHRLDRSKHLPIGTRLVKGFGAGLRHSEIHECSHRAEYRGIDWLKCEQT